MADTAEKTSARMTLEAFLDWGGDGHAGKLELINGVVRAQAPATATHAMIQGNILVALANHLRVRGSSCRALPEAPVLPPLAKHRNARVPDITVTCAPIGDSKAIEDPLLIVEVMSPSNEKDTWESIDALAALISLKEILVVQSTEVRAEVFRRNADGAWIGEAEDTREGGTVRLASIELELPIGELYVGTRLGG